METQEQDLALSDVSTQALVSELFSRDDWREAEIPDGVKVERGKVQMNAADERGESGNYVWPIVWLNGLELGEIFDEDLAEAFWRPHVNAFRTFGLENREPLELDEADVKIAHKHREEGYGKVKQKTTNGVRIREFHLMAEDAGDIKSEEEEKIEALESAQKLMEKFGMSEEEVVEMLS